MTCNQYLRVPLTVNVRFDADGQMNPVSLDYCDKNFKIDKVLELKNRTPPNVPCRFPIEFTVMIEGYTKKIYYEKHTNKWFSVKEYHPNIL